MPKDYTLDDYSKPKLPCHKLGGWNGEMPPYLKEAGVGPGMEVSDEIWERASKIHSHDTAAHKIPNGVTVDLYSDAFFFGLKRRGPARPCL